MSKPEFVSGVNIHFAQQKAVWNLLSERVRRDIINRLGLLEACSYEEGKGLYVSVEPDEKSVSLLLKLLESQKPPFQINVINEKPHTTVVYSKTPVKLKDIKSLSVPLLYSGKVKELKYWDGHDNSGVVVFLIDSPELQSLFKAFEGIGTSTDYDSYEPHITVSEDVGELTPEMKRFISRVNDRLPTTNVTFSDLDITCLKDKSDDDED